MVRRIVNWKGLNAYSVTSPLNIWTNLFLYGFLVHLVELSKRIKFCVVHYLFYWVDREGGGGLLRNLISEAEEEVEGVLNSKLEWI